MAYTLLRNPPRLTRNPAFFGIYVVEPDKTVHQIEPVEIRRNWNKLKAGVKRVYAELKSTKFTGQLVVKTTHGYGKSNVITFKSGKPTLTRADWDSLVPDDRALKKAPEIKAQISRVKSLKKGDTVQLYTKSAGWGSIHLKDPSGSQGGTKRTAEVNYVGGASGKVKVTLDNGKQYTLSADRMVRIGGPSKFEPKAKRTTRARGTSTFGQPKAKRVAPRLTNDEKEYVWETTAELQAEGFSRAQAKQRALESLGKTTRVVPTVAAERRWETDASAVRVALPKVGKSKLLDYGLKLGRAAAEGASSAMGRGYEDYVAIDVYGTGVYVRLMYEQTTRMTGLSPSIWSQEMFKTKMDFAKAAAIGKRIHEETGAAVWVCGMKGDVPKNKGQARFGAVPGKYGWGPSEPFRWKLSDTTAKPRRTSKKKAYNAKSVLEEVLTEYMIESEKELVGQGHTTKANLTRVKRLMNGADLSEERMKKVWRAVCEGAGKQPDLDEVLRSAGLIAGLGPKRKTSKKAAPQRKAPARKTTRKKAAPKKAAPKKRTSKRKTSKRASGPTKKFFWEDSEGRYGMVSASSSADAKKRIVARGKRGVKIKNKPPSWY